MHRFLAVALIIIVGVWALSWPIGRFSLRRGSELSLTVGLVARIAVVVVMTYSTAQALDRGGWFVVLAGVFILIGAGAAIMGAIVVVALWLSLTGRADA